MAVRNLDLERAGVSGFAAMMMVGHRSESVYRGIAIANEVMLNERAAKLSASQKEGRRLTSECSKTRK
jgi:hypothetical protein